MNNAPIVMSAKGMFCMEKHDEFRRSIYKKFGLRPVFRIQQEWNVVRFEKEDKVAMNMAGMNLRKNVNTVIYLKSSMINLDLVIQKISNVIYCVQI